MVEIEDVAPKVIGIGEYMVCIGYFGAAGGAISPGVIIGNEKSCSPMTPMTGVTVFMEGVDTDGELRVLAALEFSRVLRRFFVALSR